MAYNNDRNNDNERGFEFNIIKKIGVLETFQNGWSKELNIVSWNGGTPKFDVRDWNPEHDRMTKGITLYEGEAKRLGEELGKYFGKSSAAPSEEEMAATA